MNLNRCMYLLLPLTAAQLWSQETFSPKAPKVWDEARPADWATPLAGLNVRPTHISAKQCYSLPIDNLKTYPVYYPGREPAGYWEMLQRVGPKPLIEPGTLNTEADWIRAGQQVFAGMDHIYQRSLNPEFINLIRDRNALEELKVEPLPDGTLPDLRWVPTGKGVDDWKIIGMSCSYLIPILQGRAWLPKTVEYLLVHELELALRRHGVHQVWNTIHDEAKVALRHVVFGSPGCAVPAKTSDYAKSHRQAGLKKPLV